MSERKVSFDSSQIDGKILRDDDDWLVMPIVIASEIVQRYEDGYAYKSADELEKMASNAELVGAKPIKILEHPGADTNFLIQKHGDVHGKAVNFRFVKNRLDSKTGRPCRRAVLADGWWSKKATPADVIDSIRSLKMRDCSIGFSFERDSTSGEFEGVHYDYKQTNIYLDHVAAPIPAGRCPGPVCGIGYDSSSVQIDAKVIAECPVCAHMRDVGWNTAGKRLYTAYGPELFKVIDEGYLPPAGERKLEPTVKAVSDTVGDQEDLTKQFNQVFNMLNSRLPTSN